MKKIVILIFVIFTYSCSEKNIYNNSVTKTRTTIIQLNNQVTNICNELQANDYKNNKELNTTYILNEILKIRNRWHKIQVIENDMDIECKYEYIVNVEQHLNIIERTLKLYDSNTAKPEETWDLLRIIIRELEVCNHMLLDGLELYKECMAH